MDWQEDVVDGEEGAAALDKAFTIIHEGPATAVQQQKQKKASNAAEIARRRTLAAYPAVFKGEPDEARLARAAAEDACLAALEANIQETLDGTDAGVFREIERFVRRSHRPPSSAASAADECGTVGYQRVPTALVLAGGVNSADHCRTFPSLVAHLRGGHPSCFVAHLQPGSFGKAPGDAIGEVLRQVSGLVDSRACQMAALVQWYRDVAGDGSASSGGGRQGAATAGEAGAEDSEEEDSDMGDDAEGSGEEEEEEGNRPRQLRQRPAAGGAAAAAAAATHAANRQRPVVVVVEGTESVDVLCLRDFVLAVSEAHAEVPVILVLGLTTTAAALTAMLPSDVTDRCMELMGFKLASAMSRLDSLVEQVLLGGSGRWPGLLFSQAIISRLTDSFLNHYFSTSCIRQGLQVAVGGHFESQPTSAVAAAALESREALEEACDSLHPAVAKQARSVLGCRNIADGVWQAMEGWSRWAVGMQWLVLAAEAVGLHSQEFRPWKLIEEALRQSFADSQLAVLLRSCPTQADPKQKALLPLLRELEPAAAAALAERLRQRAAVVWGGEEAVREELEGLAAAMAEQEEQPGEQGGAADAAVSQPAEHEQQQEQQLKGKAKRDRFHSRKARNAALLEKSKQLASAQGGSAAAAAAAAAQRAKEAAAAPGARLAAWLAPALQSLLATPPTKLPGAAVFTCKDATSLDCLTAEPRAALHMALTEPHQFLEGLPEDSLGIGAAMEDACVAYRLFDQDCANINTADWYESFVEVHTEGGQQKEGEHGQAAGSSGSKKRKKAAVKKAVAGKGKGKAAAGGSSGEAGEGGDAGGGSSAAAAEDVERRRELAARFSQATAELQYVGLIKPARRRKGNYVQRITHMPAG